VNAMNQRNLYRIIIGILMVISGIISIVLAKSEFVIGSILLIAGIAFLVMGISRHFSDGESPESDERSKKIGAFGLSYGWLTGLFFMFALFWLDYLNILKLGTQNALALSIIVLALSARVYQIYLFRKGDVE
jgi:energy-coupling factor transporter transmembrane protein EcfT